MSASTRRTPEARVLGKQITKARKWELCQGLRVKTHKFHIPEQPKTLADMKEKLRRPMTCISRALCLSDPAAFW